MGTSSTLALIAQGKTPLTNADFTHIARVSTDPLMLLVSSKAPQKSLDDFIGYMKANPDKVTIGTPGNYNLNHIFASMTARAAGVNYVNVPYTGGSKVVADLLGEHVDSGVLKPSETLGQIQEGLLKPIGVFANERLEMFPDVPTFKDKGYDVFPYGPVVQMAYVVGAGQPARRRPHQADHRLPRRHPGSALQGICEEERVPGRRHDRRCPDQGSRQRRRRARHRGGTGLPERIRQKRRHRRPSRSRHSQTKATRLPIKKITCHVVAAPVQRPFTSSRGWLYKTRGTCLVEIETDDGIVGWGECYGPSAVAKAFIDTQLAPRVIGRDPFDVEVIWEDLYNRIKDYGPKGMSIAAISGIDIALWDIVGKACNKPVHKLIGGAFRTEVDAYATGLYFTDMDRLVDEAVEEAIGLCRRQASRRSR